MDRESYDEAKVLARYLWNNYAYLFSPEDRDAMKFFIGQQKALGTENSQLAARIREVFGSGVRGDAVAKLLSEGEDEFRRRACEELLTTRPDQVVVNRCPNCSRIARTPRSQQCLWCGHDWHRSSEWQPLTE